MAADTRGDPVTEHPHGSKMGRRHHPPPHRQPGAPPRRALPGGLTTRPLRTTDAGAVYELIAAQELEDTGQVAIEEADIVSDWAKPSHDLALVSVGVFDGDASWPTPS